MAESFCGLLQRENTSNRIPLAQRSWRGWCSSTACPPSQLHSFVPAPLSPVLATARDACQQVSLFMVKHCGAAALAAASCSPTTISSDSLPSSSSPRLADVNETRADRRCGQTDGEEEGRRTETRGKGEDKEMMTTVGDGGLGPVTYLIGRGRRRGGEGRSLPT